MRICYLFIASLMLATAAQAQKIAPLQLASPDGAVRVTVALAGGGRPTYAVHYRDAELLQPSQLGLRLAGADLSQGLRLEKADVPTSVMDSYQLQTDKRTNCHYQANRRVFRFAAGKGMTLSVVFQVSNDGVAFQYLIEGPARDVQRITAEQTTFRLPAGARGWLHPHAKAQTGWAKTQPSYEEYYKMGVAAGTPGPLGEGWSFPALFHANGHWLLLTEAGMGRTYCGTHLAQESPGGEYGIAFAQAAERPTPEAVVTPESRLPWRTPWRVVVVGNTLAPIVESTLTTDLSAPAVAQPTAVGRPGKSSWSWVLLGDGQTTYDVQHRFIDYAADMGWSYCLVDALWDKQIGYDKMQELAQYARSKKVGLLVWYNSNGHWNEAPQTPTNLLFEAENRRKEFARIKQMGIAGVKIDFFGGEGQSFINYYQDLLMDAAQAGLLVNFHGTTIPRGWQRTYPNLVSMEAVRGFEFLTFDQANTDQEPSHCAMLPFARNAVGPMDFTPMAFSEIKGKQRRTSNAFELALAVLFQSGIQHYAEVPEGMAAQPAYVQDFVRGLPSQWKDVKLLDGFPGEYVVLARQAPNGKWYVAGINATNTPKEVVIDPTQLGLGTATVITDGDTNRQFSTYNLPMSHYKMVLKMPARGGFVVQPN